MMRLAERERERIRVRVRDESTGECRLSTRNHVIGMETDKREMLYETR